MGAPRCCQVIRTIVVAFILTLGGCAIPTPKHELGQISRDVAASVRIGETTRMDVLLQFGEPAGRHAADRVFAYQWEVTEGIEVGAVAPIPIIAVLPVFHKLVTNHAFCVAFGPGGVVTATASFDQSYGSSSEQTSLYLKNFESERDSWINAHSADIESR